MEFVKSEVSQGSIIRPLLFLIFKNSLPSQIPFHFVLFADDTSVFLKVLRGKIHDSLTKLKTWFVENGLNQSKTNFIQFKARSVAKKILLDDSIHLIEFHKVLRIIVDQNCNWDTHLFVMSRKKRLNNRVQVYWWLVKPTE